MHDSPSWVTVIADQPGPDGTWACVDDDGRLLRLDPASTDPRLVRLRRGQRLRGEREADLVRRATL